MRNFKLRTSQVLQGDFQVRSLNLLLVFQVNCPGCFVYALPLMTRLHDAYGDRINMLGLSTAFEDFNFNTADNTHRLLANGEMVGMTALYFQTQGLTSYNVPIRFPVAFDGFDDPQPNSNLVSKPSIGDTFRENHLRGTPSWILFDEDSKVVAEWFGHKHEADVELILQQALMAKSAH